MASATRLLVARHGETEDNAVERWQGWGDSPLTPRGIAQAQALARRLAAEPLAAVYTSDLGRAAHTARIAASGRSLPTTALAALRERDVGAFSGLSGLEVQERFPDVLARRPTMHVLDWTPPGGESFRAMLKRILPAIDAMGQRWLDQLVLVVTHGGVIRLLAAQAAGDGWENVYRRHPSNCGLSAFRWLAGGRLLLDRFDEHDFLDEEGTPPLR